MLWRTNDARRGRHGREQVKPQRTRSGSEYWTSSDLLSFLAMNRRRPRVRCWLWCPMVRAPTGLPPVMISELSSTRHRSIPKPGDRSVTQGSFVPATVRRKSRTLAGLRASMFTSERSSRGRSWRVRRQSLRSIPREGRQSGGTIHAHTFCMRRCEVFWADMSRNAGP